MLTATEKQFTILFLIIVFLELVTSSSLSLTYTHYIAKPAIVASLIFLFVKTFHSRSYIRFFTITALIFALIGDILLMFVHIWEHYFTLGLVAFLLAHVMYILVFLKQRNSKISPFRCIVILFLYAMVLFYYLHTGLGDMLIPVVIYMLVILTMATTAFLRKEKVNTVSFKLVFTGSIFFMLSDSILALDKFYKPMPFSNISIIITYAIAQYLIVLGIIKSKCNNT
ncbi:lysoplasmalogenase [Winogradskyella aurantia]|uniref:Lysoplasmalogenase n=1 Tax=Winogradskyella aurantia TaxID=1915063 RepID=A0A265UQT7_9FLAO|nr:lysoplasmalogenase [Winogradskyella aurantia]OZV67663.1 lysoplasmalogenase [Winogradskyella aurantia]